MVDFVGQWREEDVRDDGGGGVEAGGLEWVPPQGP